MKYSSATLVDGIVTLPWSFNRKLPVMYRALTRDTRIQLKITCRHLFENINTYENYNKIKIRIHGRIGRVVRCSGSQFYRSLLTNPILKDNNKDVRSIYNNLYESLWDELEQRWFTMQKADCNYSSELYIDELTNILGSQNSLEISLEILKHIVGKLRDHYHLSDNKSNTEQNNETSPLTSNVSRQADQTLRTWADGYYFIELFQPFFSESLILDPAINVTMSMKNRHNGYITADEYPALIIYRVLCGIYSIYAIVFLIWCALFWRKLNKIHFYIGSVIFICMIQHTAYLVQYETVNRYGHKFTFFIVSAEVISCIQRIAIRVLFTMIALGYGTINSHLGSIKLRLFAISILYFIVSIIEGLIRLTKDIDDGILVRIIIYGLLWSMDGNFVYRIWKNLAITIKQLRSANNLFKLNSYRYFRITLILALITNISIFVWSIISFFHASCIANVKRDWVDVTIYTMPYSLILIVGIFLFRPSENQSDSTGEDEERTDSVPLSTIPDA